VACRYTKGGVTFEGRLRLKSGEDRVFTIKTSRVKVRI
jgi:hypothetical protein